MAAMPSSARDVWTRMRAEVNIGQYLDVVGSASRDFTNEAAHRIALLKTAKYTVERPLHIGALIAEPTTHDLGVGAEVEGLPVEELLDPRIDTAREHSAPVDDKGAKISAHPARLCPHAMLHGTQRTPNRGPPPLPRCRWVAYGWSVAKLFRRTEAATPDAGSAERYLRFPILDVQPTIAAGERPIKAVEGEAFDVSATVFREGHDALGVTVVLIEADGSEHSVRAHVVTQDRYAATVRPEQIGAAAFAVEAWDNPWGTWHHTETSTRSPTASPGSAGCRIRTIGCRS